MENKLTSPAIKGSIIALALIVISLTLYFTKQSANPSLGPLPYAVYIVGIVISCVFYSKQNNGNVTFGNVFADGFKTSAATTAIFLVYTFFALKFIMPDMADIITTEARKGMQASKMPPQEIEQGIAMMKQRFVPFTMSMGLVTYLFVGLIASLLGAVLAKKNK